jgi:hypothetical protein
MDMWDRNEGCVHILERMQHPQTDVDDYREEHELSQ